MDGSPVVFHAWEANQPAFKNNEERCVKMTSSQGTSYLLIYEDIRYMWNVLLTTDTFGKGNVSLCMIKSLLIHFIQYIK